MGKLSPTQEASEPRFDSQQEQILFISRQIDTDKANTTRFPLHRHSQMIPFTGPATNEEVTPVRESGQYIKAQTPAELI